MSLAEVPAGYEAFAQNGTRVVVRSEHGAAVRDALRDGTLHGWAATRAGAEPMRGRGVAWGVDLSDGTAVVVRHSRHGGMLAGATRDLFLAPTRAPIELAAALRLEASGVRTPRVIAYAIYPAWGPLCRADVVTARIRGNDFPTAWREASGTRARSALIEAVAALLRAMRAAGAHHPDLNVRNVLVSDTGGAPAAWVLDVDRATFAGSGPTAERRTRLGAMHSWRRLSRSIAKERAASGLDFGAEDEEALRVAAFSRTAAP